MPTVRNAHAAVVHGRPGHLRRNARPVRRYHLAGWKVGLASRVGLPSGLEQVAREVIDELEPLLKERTARLTRDVYTAALGSG